MDRRTAQQELLRRYAELLDDVQAFACALETPLVPSVWVNPLKTTVERFLAYCHRAGIAAEPIPWYPGGFRLRNCSRPGATLPFVAGWYYVQEEIAMAAVLALDPQPGERIVDLCAAPGGKTAQTALRVGPEGMVIANELQMERLSALRTTIDRLGLLNVVVTWADGRTLPLPSAHWDRVLVDAPCTGEGTLRKRTQSWYGTDERFRRHCMAVQRRLLRHALLLVRPGGIVLYSTCTFAPEENEQVLDEVLGDYGSIEPFDIPQLRATPGVRQWRGRSFRSDVEHARRFWPHHNDTGGFFIARIRRTELPIPEEPSKLSLPKRAQLQPAQRFDGIEWFCQRFGVEPELFAPYRFWMRGQEKLWMATAAAAPPETFPAESIGIPLLSYKQRQIKPKTVALQYLGRFLRRNVVELPDEEAALRFVNGQSQNLSTAEVEPGFVHVRYREFELGCGIYARGQLHSQIPKSLLTGVGREDGAE